MRRRFSWCALTLVLTALSCSSGRDADRHAFLERFDSEEALEWARRTDRASRDRIAQIPVRETLRPLLEKLASETQYTVPLTAGDALLYLRVRPGHDAPVLCIQQDGHERVLIDPNDRWPGQRLLDFRPSPSGRLLLYAVSDASAAVLTLRIVDLASGRDLPFEKPARRLSQRPWAADGESIYFTRRGERGGVEVWRSWIVSNAEERIEVPEWREDAAYVPSALSDDSLFIAERAGGRTTRHLRRGGAGAWETVSGRDDWQFAGESSGDLYFLEGDTRIVVVSASGHRNILTSPDPINEAHLFGSRFVLLTMRAAQPQLVLYDIHGQKISDIETPLGLIWTDHLLQWPGIVGDQNNAWFRTLALTHAAAIIRIDLPTGRTSIFKPPVLSGSNLTTTLVHYPSGGAEVPMFITRMDGVRSGPLLMVSYGSFGLVDLPYFNPKYLLFLSAGGTIAHPNIRGGGIHGDRWRYAGRGANKERGALDLVDAARWLVAEGYTSAEELAIEANSIGTVTAGAAALAAPGLFRAAILEVPVSDLVRYRDFPGGQQWAAELGEAATAGDRARLRAFSPYERALTSCGPAFFITAGDQDRIAAPVHAYKLAAALQRCRPAPLLRVDWGTGHGGDKSRAQRLAEWLDELSFLFHELRLEGAGRLKRGSLACLAAEPQPTGAAVPSPACGRGWREAPGEGA